MARAILFAAPDVVELESVDIPEPGHGELRLTTLATLVSPGTELRSLAGKQKGLETAFPFIPGYSTVGRADDGRLYFASGTARASVARGWGAHVGELVLPTEVAIPLPEGIDLAEAVFAKMWGIAWRGVDVSGVRPGSSVTVIGLGLVGQLSARLFQAAGAEVLAIDPEPSRRSACPVPAVESIDRAKGRRPEGAEIVVDATGAPSVLSQGLSLLRDLAWQGPGEGATYVVQGSYAEAPRIPYDDLFRKEARLVFPRDSRQADVEMLLQRVVRGELSARDLAGAARPPEKAPEVYAELKTQGARVTAAFDWTV